VPATAAALTYRSLFAIREFRALFVNRCVVVISVAASGLKPGVEVPAPELAAAPQEIEVPGEGRHKLEVRMDGYEPWSATLSRHDPIPSPIRLRKPGAPGAPPKAGKVKKFLKGLLDQ